MRSSKERQMEKKYILTVSNNIKHWSDVSSHTSPTSAKKNTLEFIHFLAIISIDRINWTAFVNYLIGLGKLLFGSGGERTLKDYSTLLEQSGWEYVQTFYPQSGLIGVIEGAKAKE